VREGIFLAGEGGQGECGIGQTLTTMFPLLSNLGMGGAGCAISRVSCSTRYSRRRVDRGAVRGESAAHSAAGAAEVKSKTTVSTRVTGVCLIGLSET
jgi:hypothetical protein